MKTVKHTIKTEGKTTQETIHEHIQFMAKEMDTGPIIGEAYGVLYEVVRNLLARDALLAGHGYTPEKINDFLEMWSDHVQERDKEILAARKG